MKSKSLYVSRTESRGVDCPRCGAAPGDRCVGVRRKIRESSHLERVERAAGLRGQGLTLASGL